MLTSKGARSIAGRQTTSATPETVVLTVDGQPSSSIAIGTGKRFIITAVFASSSNTGSWTIQQTNDGNTFFPIAFFRTLNTSPTQEFDFDTPLVVTGGPNVAWRVLIEATTGTTVDCTIRGEFQALA